MKKNLPLVILVGIVVLLAGFLAYFALDQGETPRQANVPSPKSDVDNQSNGFDEAEAFGEVKSPLIKSEIPESDPTVGEIFVYGEVQAVDVEKRILTIDQHMDDNSISINPNTTVAKDAIIQNQESDISFGEIKVGDSVGMILTKERQARAVLVNF